MVYTDPVLRDTLPIVDEQVAKRLRNLADNGTFIPSGAETRLGDSFTLWMLGADEVASAEADGWPDVLQLAKPINRWHHQIQINGRASAFFHSAPSSSAATSALYISPTAYAIDKAFAWIKNTVTGTFLVRLLETPAYHVVALWLIDESKKSSQILVVNSLVKFPGSRRRVLESREFMEVLRTQRNIGGIRSG